MAGPFRPDVRFLPIHEFSRGAPVRMLRFVWFRFRIAARRTLPAGIFPMALPPAPPPAGTSLRIGGSRGVCYWQIDFQQRVGINL